MSAGPPHTAVLKGAPEAGHGRLRGAEATASVRQIGNTKSHQEKKKKEGGVILKYSRVDKDKLKDAARGITDDLFLPFFFFLPLPQQRVLAQPPTRMGKAGSSLLLASSITLQFPVILKEVRFVMTFPTMVTGIHCN